MSRIILTALAATVFIVNSTHAGFGDKMGKVLKQAKEDVQEVYNDVANDVSSFYEEAREETRPVRKVIDDVWEDHMKPPLQDLGTKIQDKWNELKYEDEELAYETVFLWTYLSGGPGVIATDSSGNTVSLTPGSQYIPGFSFETDSESAVNTSAKGLEIYLGNNSKLKIDAVDAAKVALILEKGSLVVQPVPGANWAGKSIIVDTPAGTMMIDSNGENLVRHSNPNYTLNYAYDAGSGSYAITLNPLGA